MTDFYFHTTKFHRDAGVISCDWFDLLNADLVGAKEFKTQQLRRIAREQKKRVLKVTDSTSCAHLDDFLQHIDLTQVGGSRIVAAPNRNSDIQFVHFSLYFEDCRIDLEACWSIYKEIRAREFINHLLVPIITNGLANKCLLADGEDSTPIVFPFDHDNLLKSLERITGDYLLESDTDNYIDALKNAYKTTLRQ